METSTIQVCIIQEIFSILCFKKYTFKNWSDTCDSKTVLVSLSYSSSSYFLRLLSSCREKIGDNSRFKIQSPSDNEYKD